MPVPTENLANSTSPTKNTTTSLLAELKARLFDGQQTIVRQHLDNVAADIIVASRAKLIDEVLLMAWQNCFFQQAGLSLLAVGGYGRSELNIHSDIDLLILTPSQANQPASEAKTEINTEQDAIRDFIQLLWDIGLEVGHSVRSLVECIEQGQADITIATNMLESRHLAGDASQNDALQQAIRVDNFWPSKSFYKAKYDEQRARHARYDDIAFSLEPNIKSSPGGLRDLQTIAWVANREYHTSDFEQLLNENFIDAAELDVLVESRNQLWRIRNGLQILCKRSEDRLLIPYQRDLAEQFGYEDDDEQLAVEKLMQAYYLAVKNIRHLNLLLLQHFDQSINYRDTNKIKAIDANFQLVNDYIAVKDQQLFQSQPVTLLTVFQVYQNHPNCRGIDAQTVRAIKANLPLIDAAYRANIDNTAIFLSFFQHEDRLTHTIRKLDAYGVLGAFIPVYGQVEGQMQHDLFHAYTVDAHTLMVVRNLRRLVIAEDLEDVPYPSKLAAEVERRDRIYLGALFHDVAKGRGGNHHTLGADDAKHFCLQSGMSQTDAEFISWLVLQHLLMSKTSQREDIADPEVIERFAAVVGDQEHLDGLFLLTVADIRGTSHATWTPWKGHLLNTLHRNTTEFLASQASDQNTKPDNNLHTAKDAAREIIDGRISKILLDRFWDMFDEDYLLHYNSEALAWHAETICGAHILDLPLVSSRYDDSLETQTYVIYAADTDQLLGTITGSFDRLSQNIVDARIHKAHPGYTLLIFTVTHDIQAQHSEADMAEHIEQLRHGLIHSTTLVTPTKRLVPQRMRGFSIETEISFDDRGGQDATSMRLVTLDRAGLMHKIANTFAESRIKLVSAKISTVGEKVEDVFRITDSYGQAIDSDEKKAQLRDALLKALA